MDEFISICLEVGDKGDISSLTLEGLEFEDAREEMGKHLKYVFQEKKFVNMVLSIDIKGETSKKVSKKLENAGFQKAKDGLIEFLKYAYGIEEEYLVKPSAEVVSGAVTTIGKSDWLVNYKVEDLTRNEKVFLLLKNNHPEHWVKSQDIQDEYEIIYGEEIKLSSLSTYLARFYEKGNLMRKGSRAQREYKLSVVG